MMDDEFNVCDYPDWPEVTVSCTSSTGVGALRLFPTTITVRTLICYNNQSNKN